MGQQCPEGCFFIAKNNGAYVNEPSLSLWKRLNEVSDRLQKVSEQLVQTNAINKGYHQAFDQQRIVVEIELFEKALN